MLDNNLMEFFIRFVKRFDSLSGHICVWHAGHAFKKSWSTLLSIWWFKKNVCQGWQLLACFFAFESLFIRYILYSFRVFTEHSIQCVMGLVQVS